ncbi:rhodanese-like domain-containing protein [Pseudothauera rhizosphaerae]|uniref:Rhodanese-like domain-containing protein n=1 Tax=Pseudothauera rhizosphaerae TaxID=2565932 RepID=A0A4S4ASF2_9RHOO|nr:rhodanese-like domain-containing protein [Pseudothauera rhizosphaerae]THF62648.1 rhodanese-like domain-containing protein [Pseudothauera rhizosphaerae]
MSNAATRKSPLLELVAGAVNVPREVWKRLVNIVRGVKDITPGVARVHIQSRNALVLDVREQKEYDAGHVPNSVLIPLGQLERRLGEIQAHRERTIVVICHGGKRSATACLHLRRHRFREPLNIAGGILAWKKAKLPVEV